MQTRPYALLGAGVLAQVQRNLHTALQRAAAQWGIAPALLETNCVRAWEQPAGVVLPVWEHGGQGGACALWLGWHADAAAHCGRALFAPDRGPLPAEQAGTLVHGAARRAMDGVVQSLMACAGVVAQAGTPPALPPAVLARGSGAVLAQLKIGKARLVCLLNHDAVRALAPAAPAGLAALAPVQLAAVLSDVPVRLAVSVGGAEVGLHKLLALGVGDVVRLDRPVDVPLKVTGPGGGQLFNAYLGALDGKLAIELAHPD